MTLTVRLDHTLESALERHCLATGASKSGVVQESLAAYLLGHERLDSQAKVADPSPKAKAEPAPSANYLAFAAAGLIGTGKGGGVSATNAVVRALAVQRPNKPRP